jgi:hypothetical protein
MSSFPAIRRMRAAPRRALLAAAALVAALSSSCVESAPAGPVATLVPAEALAAVVVESPYKFYAAAEAFWKAAGLDKTLGSDLQGLLQKSVPNSAQALQVLDFARPWALAVLPGDGTKKTRQVLYVAYRSKPDELVSKLFGSGSMKLVANAKGYIVLSDAEGELAFPPAKGADLSRLSRYPASSVKLWGDPAALRRALSDSYKPIDQAIRRFVSPPAAPGPALAGDPKAAVKALEDLGLSLLAQLGLADAALEPGSTGLILRGGVAAKAGSDLQKAIAAASFAPSALDWAPQLPAGDMYGYAWSMDPGIASGLYGRMMEPLFASLGLPKDIAAKAASLQAKWSKASGPRGAMSMDLEIDAGALAGAKDLKDEDAAAVAALMKKMLKIRFDILQEAKDEAGYRALVKGLPKDADFQAFSKAYVQAFGLSLEIKNQDKKDGSFSYGELGFDFKVVDAAKLGGLDSEEGSSSGKEAVEAVLAALGSMSASRWAVSNGRFAATSGDLARLKALVSRKAADKGLASDPAFAAFAKTMPAKTVMVGSLSMRKLFGMAKDIASAAGGSGGASPAMPDPSLFGSWYSYLAVDARGLAPGLEAGLLVPASDVGALVQSGGALFKGAASGGGI